MPEVIVNFPAGMFKGEDEKRLLFKDTLKDLVAEQMSAIDPHTGVMVTFNPDADIDVTALPYDLLMSGTTATVLLKIITYDWPDRMDNIKARLEVICKIMAALVPDEFIMPGQDAVSVTFLGKEKGCWASAQKFSLDPS